MTSLFNKHSEEIQRAEGIARETYHSAQKSSVHIEKNTKFFLDKSQDEVQVLHCKSLTSHTHDVGLVLSIGQYDSNILTEIKGWRQTSSNMYMFVSTVLSEYILKA